MMKIWINGIIREMTEEEELSYIKDHEEQLPHEEDTQEILNVLIGESD